VGGLVAQNFGFHKFIQPNARKEGKSQNGEGEIGQAIPFRTKIGAIFVNVRPQKLDGNDSNNSAKGERNGDKYQPPNPNAHEFLQKVVVAGDIIARLVQFSSAGGIFVRFFTNWGVQPNQKFNFFSGSFNKWTGKN
jgi:hypothetical protein